MKRHLVRAILAVAAVVVACDDEPTAPSTTGGIVLRLVSVPDASQSRAVPRPTEGQAQRRHSLRPGRPIAAGSRLQAPPPGDTQRKDTRAPDEQPEGLEADAAAAPPDPRVAPPDSGGAVPQPRLGVAALDAARARVVGRTNKQINLTLVGGNWEGTIDGLAPGSYMVIVEGLVGGQVDYYGQTSGVQVTAGQNQTASISFSTFRPQLNVGSPTTAFRFRVDWPNVSNAAGYEIEWDSDPGFPSPNSSGSFTGTSFDVAVPDVATYYLRARSSNAQVAAGRWSDVVMVDVVTDITASGDGPGTAPFLGFGTGAIGAYVDLNIYPSGDEDWFALDACAGDSILAQTWAERLDPMSDLDTWLWLTDSTGTALVDENDDTFGLDSYVETEFPYNGRYHLMIFGFGGSVGHYELLVDVIPGPNNQGAGVCSQPDLAPTDVSGPATAEAGEIIRVDVTVDNPGVGSAVSGWTGEIRLSTDNIIDATDQLVSAYVEYATIPASGSLGRTVAVVLPQTLTPGSYFLGLIVDANGGLAEEDETNNTVASVSTISISAAAFGAPGRLSSLNLHTCRLDDLGNAQCWGDNLDGQLGDGTLDNVSSSPVTVTGGLTFAQIVTGQFHTCGLTTAREVYCWGWNGDGQLGDPNTVGIQVPTATPIVGGIEFVRIAAGWNHTCGIALDGEVWCWGYGSNGELGDGTFTSSASPVPVSGGPGFWKAIAAGDGYTCAIAADGPDGTVYCWGLNNIGQLGDGTFNDAGAPVVTLGATLASISIANWHACGVTTGGLAYCWGLGGDGELGDGTFTDSPTKVLVSGGFTWKAIVAGGFHTCGVASDLQVWCWGSSGWGQLGDSSLGTSVGMPTNSASGTFATQLALGTYHSCARRTDGQYVCWGRNSFGQLGNGDPLTYTPQVVSGSNGVIRVGAGQEHSCSANLSEEAYCWGDNSVGQVGDGGASGLWSTVPISTGRTLVNRQPSAGWAHTCVIVSSTDSYCWGENTDGQLGDGTLVNRFSPTLTQDFGFVLDQVAAGVQHTCALKNTGEAYCWGDNSWGQLGDGTTNDASQPVAVAGGITFSVPIANTEGVTIAGGQRHTCAIDASGFVWCWGWNFYGQLGDGTTTDRLAPVAVQSGGMTFATITAGDFHTCGIATDGTSWCWGLNNQGELGDGTFTNSSLPVQIAGGISFFMLSGGNDMTCGIDQVGQAYCWGLNFDGQLGDGTFWDAGDPQAVQQGSFQFAHISAGGRHACAAATDGTVHCWGRNRFGQLGTGTQNVAVVPVAVLPAPAAVAGRRTFGPRRGGRPRAFDRARFGMDPDVEEGRISGSVRLPRR